MCSSLRAGSVVLDVSRQSPSQPQEASHGNAPGPAQWTEPHHRQPKPRMGRRHRRSRRTGRFEFRTYLPGDVNADAVDAQLSNGVLTVTIPKSEEAKPRQIEIKG